jgi:hypothetical protein
MDLTAPDASSRNTNPSTSTPLPRRRNAATVTERLNLEDILRELHGRGINCGVATSPPANIRAWIQFGAAERNIVDFSQEIVGDALFWAGEQDQIARWLKETADRLFGPPSAEDVAASRSFVVD